MHYLTAKGKLKTVGSWSLISAAWAISVVLFASLWQRKKLTFAANSDAGFIRQIPGMPSISYFTARIDLAIRLPTPVLLQRCWLGILATDLLLSATPALARGSPRRSLAYSALSPATSSKMTRFSVAT